jgi:hypothetical protein
MEWSVPRPSPTPRHWYPYYEAEEEEGQEQPPYATVLQTDRFADVNEMMTQGTDSSLKPDAASAFGSDGDGGVLLRPRSSSGMPQLEESTEFQPFTSGKKAAYADSSTLPPTLPMLSSPPQQLLEQQVPTQFSAQFSEFPPGIPSLYRPSMPSPSASIMPQVAARSADYFSEGKSCIAVKLEGGLGDLVLTRSGCLDSRHTHLLQRAQLGADVAVEFRGGTTTASAARTRRRSGGFGRRHAP